ncbi:MAG TPA: hypothetical protein VJ725_12675 [Thermoanaerobaculia bacterium]|nr:hypothetical protein [Thermoanaerobaculia bacterium]
MTRLPSRWALGLLLLLAARAGALQGPAVEASREGLALTRLPPVLTAPEVRQQLGTGLTTSFVFEARTEGPQGKTRGGARVDVRYELWDEVYIVSRIDASGRAVRTTFPSFERLGEWWREARLAVIRPPVSARAKTVEVRLRVIPFSQAEQLETQRWFSQALSAEKSGSAGAVSEDVSLSQMLNLLIATSIGRAPLLDEEWKLPIPSAKNPSGKKR